MYTPEQLREILGTVPPHSLVGIGDNVLDCYLHEDLAYPGGNALNVAVYSRLLFHGESGFIGIMGDDRFAAHLSHVLDEIGVDRERVRVVPGANGMAFVSLDDDGDRRFVGSNRGGVQHELRLRLTEQDHAYISRFDRVHTSVYSSIDVELAAIRDHGTRVSYDYSENPRSEVIVQTAPHVEVGFFSGSALSEGEVDALGSAAVAAGMEVAVVTLGARGSIAFERSHRTSAEVKAVDAVDALGAGDAFVAGFLASRSAEQSLPRCLEVASTAGALACSFRGAFGYPVEAGEDARAQLLRRYPGA
ncbi:PfkB family carbohydrate kinase [Microbacterium sp. JZ70]